MAVQQTGSTTTPAAPPPQAAPGPEHSDFVTASAPGVGDAPGRMDFLSMVGRFAAGAGVTPEIERYLNDIKKELQNQIPSIELHQLPEPSAAHAFVATDRRGAKHAVILLFTDTIGVRPQGYAPLSLIITQAYRALMTIFPKDCHLLNAIMVTNQDLNRTRQMAASIRAALLPQIDDNIGATKVNVLSSAGEFAIDLNVEAAKAFVNARSPHEVQPRADIGFTVSLRRPRDRNQMFTTGSPEDQMPFLAVLAMVDVDGPHRDTTGLRYRPLVRITDISTDLPMPGLAMLAQVIAAQYFITQGGWLNAFSRFEKGAPNLGNLFPAPDAKKPGDVYHVNNRMELDQIATPQQFFSPWLCIDIAHGRARIPSIAAFDNPVNGRDIIIQAAKAFFGVEAPAQLPAVSAPLSTTWEGYYGDTRTGGRLVDSRMVTYLDAVAQHGALDAQVSRALLTYDPNPARRAEVVASLTHTFVSLFENKVTVLDSGFLTWIAEAARRANVRLVDPTGGFGYVAAPAAMAAYANFANFQGVVAPPTVAGYGSQRIGSLFG